MLATVIEITGLPDEEMTRESARIIDLAQKFAMRQTIKQIQKTVAKESAEHLNIKTKFVKNPMETKVASDSGEVSIAKSENIKLMKLNPRQTSHGIRAANGKTYGDSFFAKRGTSRKPGVYMRRKNATGKWDIKGNYVYLGAAVEFEMDEMAEKQAYRIFHALFTMKFDELSQ